MSKLKEEHIDKIESLINISMPHKWIERTVQISANRQGTITTGANIFTFDQETGLLILHFELENRQGVFEPLDLTDVRHVILGYQFDGVDGGIIEHEPYIIDVEQGIVAMIMPNQYDFSGTVYCHTFIQYLDGRSFDAGLLQMQWTKSWLDKELPQLGRLEISRFTELIYEIHRLAGVAVGEMQGQLDEFERGLLQQIEHLQSTMDGLFPIAEDLQNQIDIGGLVTGDEFEELRESVEGIATDRIESDSSWITVDESQEGKLSDKLIEGRTLVNLWSDNRDDFAGIDTNIILNDNELTMTTINGTPGMNRFFLRATLFKQNTVYTIIIDLDMDEGLELRISGDANTGITSSTNINTSGRHIISLTTRANFNEFPNPSLMFRIWNLAQEIGLNASATISIYEGDLTNLTLNHTLPRQFASPSNLVVTSMGRNIIDRTNLIRGTGFSDVGGYGNPNGFGIGTAEMIPVDGGRVIFTNEDTISRNRFTELALFNKDRIFLGTVPINLLSGVLLPDNVRFIRARSANTVNNLVPIDAPIALGYDFAFTQFDEYNSTTQTLQYQNELGEWLPVPELRGIQVDGNLLVSDEITDTEYIQRVGLVDLETIGMNLNDNILPHRNVLFQNAAPIGTPIIHVNSNRLPTLSVADSTLLGVRVVSENGNVVASYSDDLEPVNVPNVRQYFIDNDYQFLVPLAEPKRYPIRPWDLPSHEPVTHVHVDSGAVSPRTSFKVVTSIMPRLRKVENRLTNLENDFRNHIQTLARAIVQPLEKRDYKSVAMLGFPEEFEVKVEEQEVDVNEE